MSTSKEIWIKSLTTKEENGKIVLLDQYHSKKYGIDLTGTSIELGLKINEAVALSNKVLEFTGKKTEAQLFNQLRESIIQTKPQPLNKKTLQKKKSRIITKKSVSCRQPFTVKAGTERAKTSFCRSCWGK